MKRREFMTLLGGAAVTWPLAARAQQPQRVRRIGVFMPGVADDVEFQAFNATFLQRLATKVELILNLKAANALGITVPMPLLGRADEVVE